MNAFNYYRRKYPVDCAEIFEHFTIDKLNEMKSYRCKLARLNKECYYADGHAVYKKRTLVFINDNMSKTYNIIATAKAGVKTSSGYHSFFVTRDEYRLIPTFTKEDWKEYRACDEL